MQRAVFLILAEPVILSYNWHKPQQKGRLFMLQDLDFGTLDNQFHNIAPQEEDIAVCIQNSSVLICRGTDDNGAGNPVGVAGKTHLFNIFSGCRNETIFFGWDNPVLDKQNLITKASAN